MNETVAQPYFLLSSTRSCAPLCVLYTRSASSSEAVTRKSAERWKEMLLMRAVGSSPCCARGRQAGGQRSRGFGAGGGAAEQVLVQAAAGGGGERRQGREGARRCITPSAVLHVYVLEARQGRRDVQGLALKTAAL